MRQQITRLFCGATLAFMTWNLLADRSPVLSQTGASFEPTGSMQVVSSMLPSGGQQVVVIDSDLRSMAVYHIDPSQGKIQLRSVRRMQWDLQMEEFNAQAPLPSELKQVQP